MHKITLQQMMNVLVKMQTPMESEWDLKNPNYDKDILIATILHKFGDLPVLQENPKLFKYQTMVWWLKHWRTFQKWFDAFDIPYSPLENYNRKEERVESVSETGNQYNKFSNNDGRTVQHTGNNSSDTETTNKHEAHGTSSEDTQSKASGLDGAVSQTDRSENTERHQDITTDGTERFDKNTGTDREYDETKTENTTTNSNSRTNQSDYKTNTSGRLIPQYDSEGRIIGYTLEADSERTVEHGVSAYDEGAETIKPYNEGNYAPSYLDKTHGTMTDSGSANSNTTEQATGNTTTNTDGSEHIDYSEGSDKTTHTTTDTDENATTTGNEVNTTNRITSDKGEVTRKGETTDNRDESGTTKTSASDSFSNVETGTARGDSQQQTNAERKVEVLNYLHGNIGVTTSQQMLEAEIRVQLFSIYDQMAELFVDEHCIGLWLNCDQRRAYGVW